MPGKEKPAAGYVLSVCLNPVIQKTIVLSALRENEVNRSREYYLDASGKGVNLTRVLTQLGQPALHLTHTGGRFRQLFLEKCREDLVTVVWADSGSEIRFCYTLLNRAGHTTTEIVEEASPVGPQTESAVCRLYAHLLADAALVVFSGTKAAGYAEDLYPRMVQQAKAERKFVILDFRQQDLINSLPAAPDIIKPNYTEFIATFFPGCSTGENDGSDALLPAVKEKMQALYRQYGCRTILTRGRFPSLSCDERGVKEIPPPVCRDPLNTTGCGDAFTAGLAAGWLQSGSLEQAIMLGHECALQNARHVRPGYLR